MENRENIFSAMSVVNSELNSAIAYISKFWQSMIVLKVGNISELIHSFRSANGGLGIILYPLFN